MKYLVLILIFSLSLNLYAQDTSDVYFLKNMDYMKWIDFVNCNNKDNDNASVRICKNLEFQKTDSILNVKLVELLNKISDDSIKTQILDYHNQWLEHRRFQSKLAASGYRGHLVGIKYLDCMTAITRLRIQEIEYLIE